MKSWKERWEAGIDYASLMESADEKDAARWAKVYDAYALTDKQREVLGAFDVPMKVLTMVGTWCGDCVAQGPLIERLAEGSDLVEHRLMRIEDAEDDFKQRFQVNGGDRVPVMFILSEDYYLANAWGDRTVSRYRMLRNVRRANPDLERKEYYQLVGQESQRADLMAQTADELLAELERMQILFQLSPRLNELHATAK